MGNSNEELVNIEEIMPLLGQKKAVSAWDFIHRNGVPFYRLGPKKILFSRDEVLAWRNARRVGSVPLGNRAQPSVRLALMGGRA